MLARRRWCCLQLRLCHLQLLFMWRDCGRLLALVLLLASPQAPSLVLLLLLLLLLLLRQQRPRRLLCRWLGGDGLCMRPPQRRARIEPAWSAAELQRHL